MTEMREVTPRLEPFVEAVKAKLTQPQNIAKGDWRQTDVNLLIRQLKGEVRELEIAYTSEERRAECLDVAAFAMMVWDALGARPRCEASLLMGIVVKQCEGRLGHKGTHACVAGNAEVQWNHRLDAARREV